MIYTGDNIIFSGMKSIIYITNILPIGPGFLRKIKNMEFHILVCG